MENVSNVQNNNFNQNDQQLVSLVNLISNNINNIQNKNNNENEPISTNISDNSKINKKEDDLLLEIDKIIGKEDLNSISSYSSTNTNSETSSLNSNKVEIKDNHFINNPKNNHRFDSYLSPFELSEETLNEPILNTIYRDLYLIYTKLKFVINPYTSNDLKTYHIKQWDLWGPLILIIFLACTLAINSTDRSQTIILTFLIFWLGSFLVFLNAHLLGVKTSIFQIFCLLGYCLFPLNLSAFILSFTRFFDIIRFIIVGITCFWSLYSTSSFLRSISIPEQKYLVLYPSILLYLYISWFIFVTKH